MSDTTKPALPEPDEWACVLGVSQGIWTEPTVRAAIAAAVAEARAVPDDYGSTDFGYTLAGINLTDGDKRLMSMLVHAFGTDHPAIDDLVALLWRRANPSPTPPARVAMSDEQIGRAHEAAYRALVAKGYNGGMGGETWDLAAASAVIAEYERISGIAPAATNVGGKPRPPAGVGLSD